MIINQMRGGATVWSLLSDSSRQNYSIFLFCPSSSGPTPSPGGFQPSPSPQPSQSPATARTPQNYGVPSPGPLNTPGELRQKFHVGSPADP